jgi:hypothetical protein
VRRWALLPTDPRCTTERCPGRASKAISLLCVDFSIIDAPVWTINRENLLSHVGGGAAGALPPLDCRGVGHWRGCCWPAVQVEQPNDAEGPCRGLLAEALHRSRPLALPSNRPGMGAYDMTNNDYGVRATR